jgi:hypothetical protein
MTGERQELWQVERLGSPEERRYQSGQRDRDQVMKSGSHGGSGIGGQGTAEVLRRRRLGELGIDAVEEAMMGMEVYSVGGPQVLQFSSTKACHQEEGNQGEQSSQSVIQELRELDALRYKETQRVKFLQKAMEKKTAPPYVHFSCLDATGISERRTE